MSDETSERVLAIDINVHQWPGSLRALYRDRVGVNPQYALACIQQAFEAADDEAEKFDGDPPDDWVPLALLNLPEKYILGFIYVAERRKDPTLKWRELLDGTSYSDILEAVFACFMAAANVEEDEDERPLGDGPVPTTRPTPPSKTASLSASSSAGRRRSAAPSRLSTSKPRSRSPKPGSKP